MQDKKLFVLDKSFTENYRGKQPNWDPIGYVTYKRTYARELPAGGTEEFWQTLERVVNGVYRIQQKHCLSFNLPWSNKKAQQSAQEMFERMWAFKFLPPGRGLKMMGTEFVERKGSAALNNCAFVSTERIDNDFADPFCFLMDMSMLGVGVGFDTLGAGKVKIKAVKHVDSIFTIEDSREGWVDSVRVVLNAYATGGKIPTFDVGEIRKAGEKITGFGGTSAGPDPLVRCIAAIRAILDKRVGEYITSGDIVDINNLIGVCVVSGNVRRSAEIAIGTYGDAEFLSLKDYDKFPAEVDGWRWASNNSVNVGQPIGVDYEKLIANIRRGDPGLLWLTNAQQFGRMKDPPNWKDKRAKGCNPCQPGWATLLTPQGIRQMKDIKIGDVVWSGQRWTRVIKKFETGVKPVFEYRTTAGVFYGTENHRVVQRGEKIEAKDAETIDIALGPDPDLPSKVNPQDVMDGLVLGDGMTHKASGNLITLLIGVDDHDYFTSEVAPLIRDHRPGIKNEAYEVYTFIDTLPRTYERTIPDRYRFGTITQKLSFLRGLYSANGSVVSDKRVTLKAASFDVIQAAQEMLSSVGISAYYTINKSRDNVFANGVYTMRESYDLNIANLGSKRKFAAMIGFIQQYKGEALTRACVGESTRVKQTFDVVGCEFVAHEPVFDITVDAPEHTYWTGGLLVSNCGEQTLEDKELCCVSGDTRILTQDGYPQIAAVMGKEVQAWNGKEWSTVVPFLAAKEKALFRVHLSDGSFLDVTDNHGWSVKKPTERNFSRVETTALSLGMIVEDCDVPAIEVGVDCEFAYQIGWFAGDGFIDGVRPLVLVQESEYSILEVLGGVQYPAQHPPEYARPFKRVNLKGIVPLDIATQLRDHTAGLPDAVFFWSAESIRAFFGGWIDTDGCLRQNINTDHYVLHGTERKLRDAQMLLRRIGVNHASIRCESPAGFVTNLGVRTHALWCLLIPAYEATAIKTRLKRATRVGSRYAKNNAYPDGALIDRARKQKIVKIEKLEGKHDTYCFTEKNRHMGMFGNVLTYQCLVETFPANHDSLADFHRTLKFAYLYGKTVTLIPTHNETTNAVMLRNRRIGTSMTGIVQAIEKLGLQNFIQWIDTGYGYTQKLDEQYSEWMCVSRSIKTTSVKPSGTLSIIAGSTAGMHYDEAEYYWRLVRFATDSALLGPICAAQYNTAVIPNEPNTTAVYFPSKSKSKRVKKQVSAWEQFALAELLQYYWADNQVSCTISFQEHEVDDLPRILEYSAPGLKAISMLPLKTHNHPYAPLQECTREEYEEAVSKLLPIDFSGLNTSELDEKFCSNDTCEWKPN